MYAQCTCTCICVVWLRVIVCCLVRASCRCLNGYSNYCLCSLQFSAFELLVRRPISLVSLMYVHVHVQVYATRIYACGCSLPAPRVTVQGKLCQETLGVLCSYTYSTCTCVCTLLCHAHFLYVINLYMYRRVHVSGSKTEIIWAYGKFLCSDSSRG